MQASNRKLNVREVAIVAFIYGAAFGVLAGYAICKFLG